MKKIKKLIFDFKKKWNTQNSSNRTENCLKRSGGESVEYFSKRECVLFLERVSLCKNILPPVIVSFSGLEFYLRNFVFVFMVTWNLRKLPPLLIVLCPRSRVLPWHLPRHYKPFWPRPLCTKSTIQFVSGFDPLFVCIRPVCLPEIIFYGFCRQEVRQCTRDGYEVPRRGSTIFEETGTSLSVSLPESTKLFRLFTTDTTHTNEVKKNTSKSFLNFYPLTISLIFQFILGYARCTMHFIVFAVLHQRRVLTLQSSHAVISAIFFVPNSDLFSTYLLAHLNIVWIY